MSSGSFNVDGNSGATGTSVVIGTSIFAVNSAVTGTVNGGTITIVDPHFGAATAATFGYPGTAISRNWTGNTLRFGDGVSANASSATRGFEIDCYVGTGLLQLGDVVVNGGNATNRWVTSANATGNGTFITNLTINANSEFRNTVATSFFINGNITNNGTLTTIGTLSLQNADATASTNAQTISGSGVFRNATAGATANFTNLRINNTNATGVSFASAASLRSGTNGGTVLTTFTLVAGNISTGSNTFILGTTTTNLGTLAYTAGGFSSGSTFGRWWGTGTTGTAIGAGAVPTTATSRYPFIVGGFQRSLWIEKTATPAATSGGVITVSHTDAAGLATVAYAADGAYTPNRRTNASWVIARPTVNTVTYNGGTNTYEVAINGEGLFNTTVSTLRVATAAAYPGGTHQNGTTLPHAQRGGIPAANLASTLYIAVLNTDAQNIIQSAQTGNWSTGSTWVGGVAPTSADVALIRNTHNVTVDGTNAAASVTVQAGGTLTIAANTLTTGNSSNNLANTINGTLAVSGTGTFNVNGSLLIANGATFSQTGGNINIDGNSGVAGTSVPAGTDLFSIGQTAPVFSTGSLTFSGGTLTIVDPHFATTGSAFRFQVSNGSVNATGHTFRFGDGTSTTAGGNATTAFQHGTGYSSGKFAFGNLVINGGFGANRVVTAVYEHGVLGNLTINAGGQYNPGAITHVNGDITVNGDGTSTLANNGRLVIAGTTLRLDNYQSGTATAGTNAQTIGGSGYFINNATIASSTANFGSLAINNTNATGITFNNANSLTSAVGGLYTNTGTFLTTFTLVAGKINLGANTFTFGTAAATPGSLTYTAGGFVGGTVKRFINTSAITPTVGGAVATGAFPFITSAGVSRMFQYGQTATVTTGGSVTVTYNDVAGTTPVTISDGVNIGERSNSNWVVTAAGLVYGTGTGIFKLRGDGYALTTLADARIVGASGLANGTSGNGTNTLAAPEGNKTALTFAQLAGTYYFGAPSAINSIATGNWDATSTWDCACVPTSASNVIINSTHNVTISGTNAANVLQINAGGTLTGSGSNTLTVTGAITNNGTVNTTSGTINIGTTITNNGTLNVNGGTLNAVAATTTFTAGSGSALNISSGTFNFGPSGGYNRTFAVATGNTLTVSGGVFNLNGNFAMSNGTFTQTGGNINVDANSGTAGTSYTSAGGNIFNITAGTVSGSAGNITIVDPPHNSVLAGSPSGGVRSVNIGLANGNNYFTGTHTFILGDGISTTPGNTTDGFVIETYSNGAAPIQNLTVNGGNTAGRHAVPSYNNATNFGVFIKGNVTINANSELRTAYNTGLFQIAGNIINNGTLTVSTTASTSALVLGNFTVGSYVAPALQTISGTGVFRNATASPTANYTFLTINNSNGVNFASASSVSGTGTGTVSGTFTLTAGAVGLGSGSNTFTLGISTGTPGTLTYTAGGFTNGTFNRWYGGATVTLGNAAGQYPFISGTNNRTAFFGTSGAITGGQLAVRYNDATGVTVVTPFTDNGVDIEKVSNANWVLSNSINLLASTGSLRLRGDGITTVSSVANVRLTGATAVAPGTSVAGTGTPALPAGNKTTMAVADLNSTFYFSVPNVINSIATGNWSNPATWDCACEPGSGDNVIINATHNVSLDGANTVGSVLINATGTLTASANSLTVSNGIANSGTINLSGGTINATSTTATFTTTTGSILNLNGGTLNYGPSGGYNRVLNFVSGATFTASSGTANINGQLSFASGATFNQSGGTVRVDGNAAGVSANSVASGSAIILFNTGATSQLVLTGGTLICVDPHANATASLAVSYNGGVNITATGTHTLQIGDGASTDTGGNATNQFAVDLYTGSFRLNLQNYTINAPAGTNRAVTQPFNQGCNGNLTITAGELVISGIDFHVGGNIVNNGTLTTSGRLYFGTSTTTSLTSSSNTQTISGSGVFRNLAVSPTASFAFLAFNNTNATGVTISLNNLSVSNTLEIIAGRIALGSNTLTLGISATVPGTLTYTAGGFINGTFTRWFGTGTISIGGASNRFPFIASATADNRSAFFGTSGATSGGTISVTYNDATGTTDVAAITDLGVDVTKRSNASWTVANSFTFGASTGQLRLQGQGIFPVVTNFADMRITGASALAAGTSIAGTGSNANPAGNKTTMTSTDLAGTFYVGLPNVINSIATGTWGATTTWDCGCVPTATDIVVINNTHNVTLSGANVATSLTISSGGTLTANNAGFSLTVSGLLTNNGTMAISAGTVTYGPAGGGNKTFTVATGSTLTLSGGTFNVNGNVTLTGGTFTMSGGNFNIDGNNGTLAGSVAGGTNLFNITLATALTQSVTGGTITIVDPPFTGTALSFATASSGTNPVWTGNTLVLGGSTGTNITSSTVGFSIDTYVGFGRLQLGTVVANGGNTTDRYTSNTSITGGGTHMTNLTINSGSEFRSIAATTITVAGDITNNGTLTIQTGHTLSLAALSGTSVVASTLAQTIGGTGTFRNALTSPTASFGNLLFNNSTGITINVNNLSVGGTLTFTAGVVDLNTNTLSLGFNTTNIGILSYTAGGFVNGNFTRWYGTAAETIGSTSDLYPFVSGANDRNAYFGTSGVTSGGSVTVGYVEVPGVTDVTAFTDLGVDVSKVSNSYWTVSNSFTFGASTGQLRLRAPGVFTTLANVADIRITGATGLAPGTSSAGTGTVALPRANKLDMTSADLSGNFYVGIPSVINSIATGNWSNITTWDCNCVPTQSDAVVINNTHNVTLDGANAASSLTISAGGILTAASNSLTLRGGLANSGTVTISGGTITQGNAGGGNANFTNSTGGSYTISSGTHNINGGITVTGGTFTQSGGAIVVDGNANNVVSASVSTQPIVYLGAATYSLTGGTFTIVDPHAVPANYEAFRYDNGSSYNADAAHTFQFGNGVSTTPGLTTDGIDFDPFFGFGRLQFGNLVINSATGTNRYVQPLDNYGIAGNFTVTSGEYRSNTWLTYVNGNISVASGATLTADATIILANFASGTQTASTNAQTIGGAGTFRNLATSSTANLTNLTINNSNATGVTISNNLSVSGTLSFTAGRVSLGSNTFTLGTAIATPGTLSYTGGGFINGTFTRWFGTAAVTVGNSSGRYPFISGTDDRSAFFGTSGAITGGTVSVNYTDAAGTTAVTSFLDSGSGIAKVSNANWAVSNSINLGASTAFFRLRGSNITSTSDFSAVRITSATGLFAGTSIPGTGSNAAPEGNKAAMSAANLSGNMRIGYPNFIIAVANGNWNTASTWDCNCVPTAGDNATIPSPYTVTVNATSVGAGLTINSGGGLTVSGGSLTLGGNIANSGTYNQSAGTVTLGNTNGGNASFTNPSGSAFTLSLGTLNVNGNLNTVGASFTQTGGTINIDANSGTAATSTLAATDLCFIGATAINCSAGTLRIIDPPHSSIVTTTRSLVVSSAASTTSFTGTHTVEFGNGVSTTQGNTDGFIIETYNSGRVPLNNVTVNAGSATGRWTNGSFSGSNYGTHINGTFTINAGSEVRTNTNSSEYALGGNLVNNGTLTAEKAITFGSSGYTVTTPQTVSGTGTFRNLSASPTANYTGLTINNSGGVTFSTSQSTSGVGTGTVSGTLTMTLGNITLGSNTFTLGISAAATGSLSYTAGFFTNGTLSRWIGTSAITIGNVAGRFPFGSGTNDRSYYAGTSAAITTGGRVNVNYIDASGTTAVAISDAGSSVTERSNASWVVSQSGLVLGSATYLSRIQGNGVGTVTDFAASRQVFASAIAGGNSTAGTGSNTLPAANKSIASTTDIAGTFYFGIGSITCAQPTALTATSITTGSAALGWTAGGSETAWDIEWMLSSASPTGTPNVTGTTTNPYSLGGLSSGTSYKFYVRASCGGSLGNSPWVGPFTFSTLFPAATNDLVCGAIPLTVNEQAVFATYSNTGATTDAAPSVAGSCQSNINSDVWFSAVVPAEGSMSVYFRSGSTGTPLADMVLHVYSSSNNLCSGTLTQVVCNDDDGPGNLPFAHFTGLTPGATLFIRASDYNLVNIGTFDIAVTPYWQWTGATSTSWATTTNWLSDDITVTPTTTSNVLIPNVANDPVNTGGAGIAGIKVLPGATVTNNGGNLTVRTFLVSNNAQFLGPNLVVMTGTVAQTISGNGSTFTNLRINNTSGVTVASGANMQTITTSLDLRSGNLTTNGNITIQSTSTSQAYIDDFSGTNTGTISGNVNVERFIPPSPNGFRYIGQPVNTGAGVMAISAMQGFTVTGVPGQTIPLPTCSPTFTPLNIASNSPYGNLMYLQGNC
jgi:hypothetical protein